MGPFSSRLNMPAPIWLHDDEARQAQEEDEEEDEEAPGQAAKAALFHEYVWWEAQEGIGSMRPMRYLVLHAS